LNRTFYIRRPVTGYANIGITSATLARGDYAACVGDNAQIESSQTTAKWNGVCYLKSTVRPGEIPDGMSYTYFGGEKSLNPDYYATGQSCGDDDMLWVGYNFDSLRSTFDADPTYWPRPDQQGTDYYCAFGAAHISGFHMLLCDGSVQSISYSIAPGIHARLGNRQDGQSLDGNQF